MRTETGEVAMDGYFLYADETNTVSNSSVKFFIYGGLFFPVARLPEIHREVEQIRADYGFLPIDELKFDTRSRPHQVTQANHTSAKSEVLDAAVRLDAKFVACIVLHEIARKKTQDVLIGWGVNVVLGAFHRFLDREDGFGIVAMDRIQTKAQFGMLKEKFRQGLITPSGTRLIRDRIHSFSASAEGTSHAASVADIVLGAFRFCVNDRQNAVCAVILPKVVRLLWSVPVNGHPRISNYGLLFRPENIRSERYKQEYSALAQHLRKTLQAASTNSAQKAPSR